MKIIPLTKKILIANKESIVCAWHLIHKELTKNNTEFIPLVNLLIKQNATKDKIDKSEEYFRDKDINSQSVKDFLDLN